MYEERKKKKEIESRYGFWLKNTTKNQQKKNMSQNPNDINQKMSLFTISQGAYANETN